MTEKINYPTPPENNIPLFVSSCFSIVSHSVKYVQIVLRKAKARFTTWENRPKILLHKTVWLFMHTRSEMG
jgi:hypothetical protein